MKQSEVIKANNDRMSFIKDTKIEFTNIINKSVEDTNKYILDKVLNNLETDKDMVLNTPKNQDLLGDYFTEIIIPQINKNIISIPVYYVGDSLYNQKEVIETYFKKIMKANDLGAASRSADKYLISTFMYSGTAFLPDSQIKELQITKADLDNLLFLFIAYLKVNKKTIKELTEITSNYVASIIRSRAEDVTDNIWERNDRALLVIYSSELKINNYLYAGRTSEKSRQFCLTRVNKIFTYEEVMEWADLEWPQKQPYKYSPFLDCGGFGCKHVLIPVPDEIENDTVSEKRWTQILPGVMKYI